VIEQRLASLGAAGDVVNVGKGEISNRYTKSNLQVSLWFATGTEDTERLAHHDRIVSND
jgi:hypothetical protein